MKKSSQRRPERAKKFPTLDGRGVQQMHPRVVNVSFDVTQEVAAALRQLRDTGLFGNGVDCASVAEELMRQALRQALLDPGIATYWQNRERELRVYSSTKGRFKCRECGHRHLSWAAKCVYCNSRAGLEVA